MEIRKEKVIKIENDIYGVIGKSINDLKKEYQDNIYQNKIYIINSHIKTNQNYPTVSTRMEYEIKKRNLTIKNLEKKMIDSLKIVGLRTSLLNQNIHLLSTSEKKLIHLAICLITNPDMIIMEEPMKDLDKRIEKRIYILLQKMKDQYQKTIIFISEDTNLLYQYTNKLLIYKNKELIRTGNTKDIFQDISFLKKNRIKIPDIIEITYLAKKKKNIKLEYHKDIRDIIKDIYKHV